MLFTLKVGGSLEICHMFVNSILFNNRSIFVDEEGGGCWGGRSQNHKFGHFL